MNRLLFALASILLTIQLAYALSVEIKGGAVDCYFEELEVGEKITISYEVGDGSNDEIDFLVKDPIDAIIISTVRTSSDTHTFQANTEGKYTYCFDNSFSPNVGKNLRFNVHENFQKLYDSVKETTDPLEREIAELAESIFDVKAKQEYTVYREIQHRDTAESTNARVKWWSTAQIALLIAVCLWQVYYLKRFFEVKRAV